MATSRELRNKIQSITNTKKITKTMEMISTAKSRVCQRRIEEVQPYGDKLTELLHDLHQAGSSGFPLLRRPEKIKRLALFVITGNRGLCGGYNSNTLIMAEKYMGRREHEGTEVEVHMIGKKGISRFKYSNREVHHAYTQFDDKPVFEQAEAVFEPILERYSSGEIDAVTIISTRYQNAARQAPREHPVLPIPEPEEGGQGAGDFIFEPSPEAILDTLLPLSLKMQLFQALVEAAASEQIARRIAMKNATDNAEEMIRETTQLYNRSRQAGITQEILEIIGGSESL